MVSGCPELTLALRTSGAAVELALGMCPVKLFHIEGEAVLELGSGVEPSSVFLLTMGRVDGSGSAAEEAAVVSSATASPTAGGMAVGPSTPRYSLVLCRRKGDEVRGARPGAALVRGGGCGSESLDVKMLGLSELVIPDTRQCPST